MNDRFRQSLVGLIWPGPIAGPIPITVFRLISPVLVFYQGPFLAAMVMSVVSSVICVFYFELLELTGGKKLVEKNLARLPKNTAGLVRRKSWLALLVTSSLVGVFPFALSLRLLKYPKTTSESLLVVSSFINSFIWTGFVWGMLIEFLKRMFLS